MDTPSDIRRTTGGSHSAILFSYILGLALDRLEKSWKDEGEQCKHPSFSLLFMDDLLVAFASWPQALRLSAQLQQVLSEMGLGLNLAKTCLMSHESVLARGRELCLPDSSLLQAIPWQTSCMCLKKPILVEAAGKASHFAYESLQQCFRRGHWSSIPTTVHMCNQYVGATWYWYSPLMEPLLRYQQRIRSLQTTFMVLMLGLFIPSEVPTPVAHWLHRLRRRATLVLMNHFPHRQWCFIWAKRRWGYLGHVLRRHDTYVAKQDMLALSHVRQHSPGPFAHLHKWGMEWTCSAWMRTSCRLRHLTGMPGRVASRDYSISSRIYTHLYRMFVLRVGGIFSGFTFRGTWAFIFALRVRPFPLSGWMSQKAYKFSSVLGPCLQCFISGFLGCNWSSEGWCCVYI